MSALKGTLDLFDRLSDDTPTNTPKATFKRESVHDIDGELELGKMDFGMKLDRPHAAEGYFDDIHLGQAETFLLLGLAGIIVHDLFRTGENDDHVVAGPSHLALSPLCGRSQEAQDSVRTQIDGKLKSDTFAEVDIVEQPPQVGP
ncbi:hypothetical protein N0V91_003393 [Didymella pomorum]|uniref:Uncharacterized protein n=1 Tax=Didymella pomorum TaxID=749634 RepID=A0A9W9DAE8_9PLEO|nr:hypothetical protein N0V91_003393 [Didymella pomorum]